MLDGTLGIMFVRDSPPAQAGHRLDVEQRLRRPVAMVIGVTGT